MYGGIFKEERDSLFLKIFPFSTVSIRHCGPAVFTVVREPRFTLRAKRIRFLASCIETLLHFHIFVYCKPSDLDFWQKLERASGQCVEL